MLRNKLTIVIVTVLVAMSFLLGTLVTISQPARATTGMPGYDIVLSEQNAPNPGRPAPYGQWIVTHNNTTISQTQDLGTVARTNGYDINKVIFCDNGAYQLTGNLYARTTSTGSVYTITTGLVFPANTRTYSTVTYIAPWMSLGLTTGAVTETTVTCGIFAQTP